MNIVIVRDNIVEDIIPENLYDPPSPKGTKDYKFGGTVSLGWTWNDGKPSNPNPPRETIVLPVFAGKFIRVLCDKELYEKVSETVKKIGGLTEILWNRASLFERDDPLLIKVAKDVGISDRDLDKLFVRASLL